MNTERACNLVFSVACLVLGFSMALHLGDSVAAALVLLCAVLSWVQWTVAGWSQWFYCTARQEDVPTRALGMQAVLFLLAVLMYAIALVRMLVAIIA